MTPRGTVLVLVSLSFFHGQFSQEFKNIHTAEIAGFLASGI
jgi:hypothetical protein